MEKFRPFTDRATGIDPFVFFIKPTLLSYTIACILFPFRLLLALVLILLLMLLDLLHFALHACGTYVHYVVSMLLFLPFARHFCLRGILFVLANCTVHQHKTPLATHAQVTKSKNKQWTNIHDNNNNNVPEVIVINMQSIWDVFVAELALNREDCLIAFPLPQNLQPILKKEQKEQKQKAESSSKYRNVKVFRPGCLSRWHVMMYIYYTGTLHYLQQWRTNSKNNNTTQTNSFTVNLRPLQEELMQECKNIPILLFAEGTTSNGRGILALPSLELIQPLCNCKHNTCTHQQELQEQELYIQCISIYYNSPSLLTVITETNKTNLNSDNNNIKESKSNVLCALLNGCKCCFQFGSLLFGSKDVKWRSPFFPSAIYTIHKQQITHAQAEKESLTKGISISKIRMEEDNSNNNNNNDCTSNMIVWKIGAEAMREVQAGFINVMTNRMLQRQRLSVGIAEKL